MNKYFVIVALFIAHSGILASAADAPRYADDFGLKPILFASDETICVWIAPGIDGTKNFKELWFTNSEFFISIKSKNEKCAVKGSKFSVQVIYLNEVVSAIKNFQRALKLIDTKWDFTDIERYDDVRINQIEKCIVGSNYRISGANFFTGPQGETLASLSLIGCPVPIDVVVSGTHDILSAEPIRVERRVPIFFVD